LQKFLQDKAGGHEFLTGFDGADEFPPFGGGDRRVAPESQRPNAGINKEAHRRERSAL
jgi:hypothetical protein